MTGLQYLDANHAEIDPQVGEKAVGGRDTGKQHRLVALHLGDRQGSTPRLDEITGVSVEEANYRSAAPHLSQHELGHLYISNVPQLSFPVVFIQIDRIGVQFVDVCCSYATVGVIKDDIGIPDVSDRLQG